MAPRRTYEAVAYGGACARSTYTTGVASVVARFEDDAWEPGGKLRVTVQSYPAGEVDLKIRAEDLETLAKALTELARKVQRGDSKAPTAFRLR